MWFNIKKAIYHKPVGYLWVDSICSFIPGTPGHGTVEEGLWPIVYKDMLSTTTLRNKFCCS